MDRSRRILNTLKTAATKGGRSGRVIYVLILSSLYDYVSEILAHL